ncbi:aromatic ring-hydroxylating dioxygenase subunit alpha [Dactylosporangium roseum]|uniref:Aromatic ring-hydroxylating dioxygenase subunit alpha n=1 Tax=Dactylosporangium roseum TaxID=47989 RepID=A0ABY5YZB5_9ACTN|nr:aromatic ring-hydroxylating dioxygenase subunit alpha [Dactylosporangium roseum]UWZ34567.1 aromatic ring-hydroxylating dioxygenase subunit alpha [Dactylosporangium roseum]
MLVSEIPALREYWYNIAYSSDVTNKPVGVRLLGDDYVVWRTADGTVSGAVDECPHRSARLSQGWVTNGRLTCPYHGWQFDASGKCVEIPSNDPGLPIPPLARTHPVLVEERYGLVWMCVGMPRTSIPVLPEAGDDSYTFIHELMQVWDASAPRIIDNALDVSHVSWVHKDSVGSSANPRLEDVKVVRDGESVSFSASYTVRIDEVMRKNTGITSDYSKRTTRGELVNPLMFRGVLEYHDNGLIHVLYKTATPIDDHTTLFCQFVARNDNPDEEKQQLIRELDGRIQSEDRELLQSVRADFPIEATTEIHAPSDRMTIQYRRVLADLAAEHSIARPDNAWARPLAKPPAAAKS